MCSRVKAVERGNGKRRLCRTRRVSEATSADTRDSNINTVIGGVLECG